jgi:hypothetical protein
MSDQMGNDAVRDADQGESTAPADRRLPGLLRDLETLRQYLDERGKHAYELAQRFLANAARDPSSRAYDERQATMLEYQHYIWHEIAGRVGQLLAAYGEDTADSMDGDAAADRK